MIELWIALSVMIVMALVFVMLTCFKSDERLGTDANQLNIGLYRRRMSELQQDKQMGLLSDEDYLQAQSECEHALLSDVRDTHTAQIQSRWNRPMKASVLVLLPLLSFLLYNHWGSSDQYAHYLNLDAQDQRVKAIVNANRPANETIMALKQHLETYPEDMAAWYHLARNLAAIEHYSLSGNAYEKLLSLMGKSPDAYVMAEYVQALYMAENGLSPQAQRLSDEVLRQIPNHSGIMSLYAMHAMGQKDYAKALDYWQRAIGELSVEHPDYPAFQNAIQHTKALLDKPSLSTDKNLSRVLKVRVQLDEAFASDVKETDTLFIFARAANGPKVPLAIVKKTVASLPLTIELTDDMAMSPAAKLSQFDKILVGARVSKSGQAMAQPGDLQGYSSVVERSNHESPVLVRIDHRVSS